MAEEDALIAGESAQDPAEHEAPSDDERAQWLIDQQMDPSARSLLSQASERSSPRSSARRQEGDQGEEPIAEEAVVDEGAGTPRRAHGSVFALLEQAKARSVRFPTTLHEDEDEEEEQPIAMESVAEESEEVAGEDAPESPPEKKPRHPSIYGLLAKVSQRSERIALQPEISSEEDTDSDESSERIPETVEEDSGEDSESVEEHTERAARPASTPHGEEEQPIAMEAGAEESEAIAGEEDSGADSETGEEHTERAASPPKMSEENTKSDGTAEQIPETVEEDSGADSKMVEEDTERAAAARRRFLPKEPTAEEAVVGESEAAADAGVMHSILCFWKRWRPCGQPVERKPTVWPE